jgi:hypothetical protein
MFRAADVGRIWVPVVLPSGEGDTTVHLLFQVYTRDELRERERAVLEKTGGSMLARAGEVKTTEDLVRIFDEVTAVGETDHAELLSRTHDWRDIADSDGTPWAYAPERLKSLLEYRWIFDRMREALFTASREGVRKNLSPGPDGSPTPAQA